MGRETENQITQIKNSDVNNGTEFYRLRQEVKDHVNERTEEVYENIGLTNENVEEVSIKLGTLINERNKNLPTFREMEEDIQEILQWKSEIKKEIDEKLVKTETVKENSVNEKTESNPNLNVDEETDIEINIEDEITAKTISMKSARLRFEWYKFSARFVTEEFKVQYVHPDAEATNKKKVFDWYDKCCDMGLVPDEFKINDEEEESKEENNQSSKKSFHKQRKEEWKKRNNSRNVFEVSEDKKEKEHVFC